MIANSGGSMAEVKVGLMENFAIKNWYKFVLYLGGVTLIMSFFLEPKEITINELRGFAFWSITVGLFVWILRNAFSNIEDYWWRLVEKGKLSEYEVEERLKALIMIWWFVNIMAFVYWLMCVLSIVY